MYSKKKRDGVTTDSDLTATPSRTGNGSGNICGKEIHGEIVGLAKTGSI